MALIDTISKPTMRSGLFYQVPGELAPTRNSAGEVDHAETAKRHGQAALDHLAQMIPGDKAVLGAQLLAGLAEWNGKAPTATKVIAGGIGALIGAAVDVVEIAASPIAAAVFGISAGIHKMRE